MIGILVLAGAALVGVYYANKELTKTTGEKLVAGDNAFVHASNLSTGTPADDSSLKAMLASFANVDVKVSNVVADMATKLGHGSIVGFGPTVTFPLSAVSSIDRNGVKIV